MYDKWYRGERAGNASMEEIVMAIKTRKDFIPFFTDVNTKEIIHSSRLLSSILVLPVN